MYNNYDYDITLMGFIDIYKKNKIGYKNKEVMIRLNNIKKGSIFKVKNIFLYSYFTHT